MTSSGIFLAAGGVATVAQALTDGQAVSLAFPAGVELLANYRAIDPATITEATRQVSVDGGAWGTSLGQTPAAGAVVAIRTRVVDSEGSVRFFPSELGSSTLVVALPPVGGSLFTRDGANVTHVQAAAVPPALFVVVGTEVVMEAA
jgi:hypothetical protein